MGVKRTRTIYKADLDMYEVPAETACTLTEALNAEQESSFKKSLSLEHMVHNDPLLQKELTLLTGAPSAQRLTKEIIDSKNLSTRLEGLLLNDQRRLEEQTQQTPQAEESECQGEKVRASVCVEARHNAERAMDS